MRPLVFIIPQTLLFDPDRNIMRYELEYVSVLLDLVVPPPFLSGKTYEREKNMYKDVAK